MAKSAGEVMVEHEYIIHEKKASLENVALQRSNLKVVTVKSKS